MNKKDIKTYSFKIKILSKIKNKLKKNIMKIMNLKILQHMILILYRMKFFQKDYI